MVGFLSKAAGQKIITNLTNCIQCNQCNVICPMTLDVKAKAQAGKPLKASLCVGCGHCVDICPTKTLAYQTHFGDWKHSLGKSS
jgi:Pyruvate/2-oxoacid:ferredoxin oxidoreductase delta subunit